MPADEPALRRLLKMTPGKTFDFIDWRRPRSAARLYSRAAPSRARPGLAIGIAPWHRRAGLSHRSRARDAAGTRAGARVEEPPPRPRERLDRRRDPPLPHRTTCVGWCSSSSPPQRHRRPTVNAEVVEVRTHTTQGGAAPAINGTAGRRRAGSTTPARRRSAPPTSPRRCARSGISDTRPDEPLAIVRPITDLYYAIGYRHAVVDAKPVRLDGTTAVLDVTIQGPPTLVVPRPSRAWTRRCVSR